MTGAHTNFLCPQNDEFYAANRYEPLDTDAREIRVLDVQPGSRDDPIECSLVQAVSLSSPDLGYKALSYCAGSPHDVKSIRLLDIDFNVFKPIWHALRRIRREHEVVRIWIDQLCIDQSNAEERGRQVSLMGEIYSKSTETFAWLGHEEQAAMDAAFSFLRRVDKLHEEYELAIKRRFDTEQSTVVENQLEFEGAYEAAQQLQGTVELADIEGFLCLVRRPWWTRCWIIQETLLSPCVTLLTGTSSLPLADANRAFGVLRFANWIIESQEISGIEGRGIDQRPTIANSARFPVLLLKLKFSLRDGDRMHMLEALDISRYCHTSDLRDHVYAILGLIKTPYHFAPSYATTNSTKDVFVEATKAIVNEDGRLDILAYCAEERRDATLDLPSWVPDFSAEVPPRTIRFNRTTVSAYRRNVSCKTNIPTPTFVADEQYKFFNVLSCWMIDLGLVAAIGTLGVIGNAKAYPSQLADDIRSDWHRRMLNAIPGPFYTPTEEPLDVAFRMTVNCGLRDAASSLSSREEASGDSAQRYMQYRSAAYSKGYFEMVLRGNIWRFFVSPSGYIGIAPAATKHDDILAILFEADTPFVLRRSGTGENCYTLVGPAYIHGIQPRLEIEAVYRDEESTRQRTLKEIRIY